MANSITQWFEKRSANPFREFSEMQGSMEQLINEFMSFKKMNDVESFSFTPSSDVFEDENRFVFKFDLPGVTKDQITVEADRDQLVVRAERKEERKTEGKKKYLSEVRYGSYERRFNLPSPVDEKKVDAHFEDGVLTLIIPKSEASKMKQIAVH